MLRKSLFTLAVFVTVFASVVAFCVENIFGGEPIKSARIVFKYLDARDYEPEYDSDGDIIFKRGGKTYLLVFDEDDEFFRILYVNFYSYKNESDMIRSYVVANLVNHATKVAKLVVPKKYVVDPKGIFDSPAVAIESFNDDPHEFARSIPRSTSAIQTAAQEFSKQMEDADND